MAAVEVLDITLAEIAHERRAALRVARREKQVDVIRHQAIGVQRALRLGREIAKVKQVDEVIAVFPETRLPVVTALNDVYGDVGHDESRQSRHTATTAPCMQRLTK